jgi:hypothetical protein
MDSCRVWIQDYVTSNAATSDQGDQSFFNFFFER